MKRNLLILLLLSGLTAAVGGYWIAGNEEKIPYLHASSEVQILKKDSQGSHGTLYSIKAGDIDGEAVLTSAPTATVGQSIIHSQVVGIESAFASSRVPYAGHITAQMDCNAKKFVKEQSFIFEGEQTKLILAVANARRILGSCLLEEIKHVSGFWAAYDQQRKQVLTLKLFKRVEGPEQIDQSQQEVKRVFQKIINDREAS